MRPPAVGVVVLAFLDHAPFYSHGCLGCGWREGTGETPPPALWRELFPLFFFFSLQGLDELVFERVRKWHRRRHRSTHMSRLGSRCAPGSCSEQYRRLWYATCLRPGVLTASVGCEQPQSIYAQQGKSHDFSGADDAYGSGRAPPPRHMCMWTVYSGSLARDVALLGPPLFAWLTVHGQAPGGSLAVRRRHLPGAGRTTGLPRCHLAAKL